LISSPPTFLVRSNVSDPPLGILFLDCTNSLPFQQAYSSTENFRILENFLLTLASLNKSENFSRPSLVQALARVEYSLYSRSPWHSRGQFSFQPYHNSSSKVNKNPPTFPFTQPQRHYRPSQPTSFYNSSSLYTRVTLNNIHRLESESIHTRPHTTTDFRPSTQATNSKPILSTTTFHNRHTASSHLSTNSHQRSNGRSRWIPVSKNGVPFEILN